MYNPSQAPPPAADAQQPATPADVDSPHIAGESSSAPYHKRRAVSSANIFQRRLDRSQPAPSDSPATAQESQQQPHADEVRAYLALPQIENENEWSALKWWKENEKLFPNLARMARQYLGCPATSATVERLFSKVGKAFSDQRKSTDSDTLSDMMFAKCNLE